MTLIRTVFTKGYTSSKILSSKLSQCSGTCGPSKKPIKVLVTGAAGQIGYSILPRLAAGDVWGPDQPVILKMLDIPVTEKVMHGVRMELEDCSFKALKDVQIFTDSMSAFTDNDLIVMLANSMDLKANMTRADLLKENLKVYKEKAQVLKSTCHQDLKVLMIANPANTNCMLLIESLKGVIDSKNFTCLTRLDHNRTRTMLAQKLGVPNDHIRKVIVWGNHSSSMYPDIRFAEVYTPQGWVKAINLIEDKSWFQKVMVPTIRERAFAVITARGKSSSLSASSAAIDHLRNWYLGTPKDDWVSMGVYCDHPSYDGIPKGVVYGHPCTCHNGVFKPVTGLDIDDQTKKMMEVTGKELIDERTLVFSK